MKDKFPGYYKKSDEQIKQAWEDCLFVFDANVLLNLYRYPQAAKRELLRVLEELNDRVWVPHQAALEFQRNRLQVIAEQIGRFSDVRKLVDSSKANIVSEINKLQLEKRHSAINPEKFLENLDSVFVQFQAELSSLESRQADVIGDDEVRDALDEILNGKIGDCPESQAWLDDIYKEGEERFKKGRPPGFQDTEKSAEFFHNGLRYDRKFGDLILWKQLLKRVASDNTTKRVIFVTDDQKEDWWWIEQSRGKKTIGPRPELTEEILQEAGVDTFLMYTSARFFGFASEYLGLDIQEKSIQQVRDVVEQSSPDLITGTIFDSELKISRTVVDNMDATDVEYLDLLETFEEGFAQGGEVLGSIANLIRNVGAKMSTHTEAINSLKEGGKQVAAKDAKRVINEAARDISDFADQLEERTAGFPELFEQSISMLTLAAVRIEEEERERQILEVVPHLKGLLFQIETSITSYAAMRDAIANLPRLTGNLNRAKRRGVSASDIFINAINKIKQITEETITFLEEQITDQ